MLKPVVLFRSSLVEENELEVCKKYFPVITQRTQVQKGDLVIPRYSALPWYYELEKDIEYNGGEMLNSYQEHCYVADLQEWYYDLEKYTPKTWFKLEHIPEEGPFVLKGQTNSKKFNFNTHMFARNKKEAIQVYGRLSTDGYLGEQNIYIRKFVPLNKLTDGLQGLPISEEYRFFILDGEILSGAFYWSEHVDFLREEKGLELSADSVPKDFLDKIISIVSPNIRFFVLDVARTADGDWVVIELNDGQCSGLSMNDPDILYGQMLKVLNHGR